ncbi:NAD(+) synthase [Halobacteriales archaeon QS_8_69_73]|nr:MAG: NAD(+) synthase [Halobacteriales archaeon QS_8_69_73]
MIGAVDDVPELTFRTEAAELEMLREELVAFVRETVAAADADGVVVLVSGGVDSVLTAALCVESTLEGLGVDPTTVQLQPLVGVFEDTVAPKISTETDRLAVGNAVARLRMVVAYYAANATGRLVCGTLNRTELLFGYHTKHGAAAADLRPIAGLYKTEVRALARHVDVPTAVVERTPTAGLWAGQTDEAELGAPYGLLDVLLHELVERDLGIAGTADSLGVDESFVARYAHRIVENRHKREPAPSPNAEESGAALFFELEGRV